MIPTVPTDAVNPPPGRGVLDAWSGQVRWFADTMRAHNVSLMPVVSVASGTRAWGWGYRVAVEVVDQGWPVGGGAWANPEGVFSAGQWSGEWLWRDTAAPGFSESLGSYTPTGLRSRLLRHDRSGSRGGPAKTMGPGLPVVEDALSKAGVDPSAPFLVFHAECSYGDRAGDDATVARRTMLTPDRACSCGEQSFHQGAQGLSLTWHEGRGEYASCCATSNLIGAAHHLIGPRTQTR